MKTPFFTLPRHLLLHAVSTLCIGLGCAYPLATAMHLFEPGPLCLAVCACAALFFALLDCMPRLRGIAYPLVFLALFSLVWQYRDQAQAVSAALTLFLNGQPLALSAYSRPLCVLLALLMTSVGSSLARSEGAFFPLSLLTIAELIVISFLGIDVSALSFLPLVMALLIAARAPGVGSLRIVPCAALVLLGTIATNIPLSCVGLGAGFAALFVNLKYWRCPHCGGHQGRDPGQLCRHCGEELKELED